MAAIRTAVADNICIECAGSSFEYVSVIMVTSIAAPVLQTVDPTVFGKLLVERVRYKLQVESRKAELPALKTAPNSANID